MAGVVGVFHEVDTTVDAIHALKNKRLAEFTVYSAAPRHELEHAIDAPPSVVRVFTLIGGLAGATFGYWIAIWISDYWPLVVGGKAIASWIPYTVFGFEVMVLVGALATVFGMFANARIPNIMTAVGYDPRFSGGEFGVFINATPDQYKDAEQILRNAGATEVRVER